MRGMRGTKGLLVAGTLLVLGCGGPKRATVPGPQVGGQRVTVVEFTPVAATNYNAPTGSLGLALAEEIAGELRRQGHTAEAIPAGGQPTGDVIVRGRLVRMDGGSRALRYWVGFGAGAAKFGTAVVPHRGRTGRSPGRTMVAAQPLTVASSTRRRRTHPACMVDWRLIAQAAAR